MRTNFICKAFLLTAALFSTALAEDAKLEDVTVEKNEFSNTATFIGGPIDGIVDDKKTKCDVDIDDIKQYAVVSEKVFGIKDVCNENYVVALSVAQDENVKYQMVKARVVESSKDCNDAQVILNKETYDKFSTAEEKTEVVWAVVDSKGEIKLKVNYEAFKELDESVGIPANVIQSMFEESAKDMVINDVDAQGNPWDTSSSGNSYVSSAAIVAAAAGLVCFAGYKVKSKRSEAAENSLAIPDLPPLSTTINTVSDHPDGLPRVDIYNPPLEFYHFPMDTSYDIVDIRPDFYD
eukprot:jgi/Orpsp1_1/1192730/evm.model.d7180000095459.1